MRHKEKLTEQETNFMLQCALFIGLDNYLDYLYWKLHHDKRDITPRYKQCYKDTISKIYRIKRMLLYGEEESIKQNIPK